MSKKTKTYRGQRNYKNSLYNGCGCFYCTGNSKQDLQFKKQSIIDKEINEVLKYNNKNTIMKIQIDTELKEIKIEEKVNLGELIEKLKMLFPNGVWKEYKIEVSVIYNCSNPIIIEQPINPFIYPNRPFYEQPFVTCQSTITSYNVEV